MLCVYLYNQPDESVDSYVHTYIQSLKIMCYVITNVIRCNIDEN